jgi:hypothetical protein
VLGLRGEAGQQGGLGLLYVIGLGVGRVVVIVVAVVAVGVAFETWKKRKKIWSPFSFKFELKNVATTTWGPLVGRHDIRHNDIPHNET